MAFSAGLKKTSSSNRSTQQNQNSRDEIVIIEDYDLAKAIMYAHRDDPSNPRPFEITIKKSEVLRADEALKNKGARPDTYGWMGHSIDEKMKKKFPKGTKVILTRAMQVSMNKETGRAVLEAHRINSVNVPEKTFTGIFTLSARTKDGVKRVSRIQSWNKNGINIRNTAAIENLKNKIDEARSFYGKKEGEYSVTKPSIGFQFRTSLKTDKEYEFSKDENAKSIYEAVDFSIPFDWIPGSEDETGNLVKGSGHLVTGDEFMTYLEGYSDYIRNHEMFKDNFDNLKIEVCYFDVYLASSQDNMQLTFNNHLDAHKDKNPLYQLTHRKSYLDLSQTEMLEGRNAAVNGILQVTADKIMKVDGKLTEIPNNWAVRLHANNYRGHVHAFIRTEEGEKVVLHPTLALLKNEVEAGNSVARHSDTSPEVEEKKSVQESSENAEERLFGDSGFLNTEHDNLFD